MRVAMYLPVYDMRHMRVQLIRKRILPMVRVRFVQRGLTGFNLRTLGRSRRTSDVRFRRWIRNRSAYVLEGVVT